MFDEQQRTEGEIVPLKITAETFILLVKVCELCQYEPVRQSDEMPDVINWYQV